MTVSWFGVRLVLYAAVPDRSKLPAVRELKSAGPPAAGGTTHSPTPSPSVETRNDSEPALQSWTDDQGLLNYLSTVPTDGGWAKIQWNREEVTILDSLPEAGYESHVTRQNPTRIEITFVSGGKSTEITAWWSNNAPKLDVDNGDG
ncbi:hypothetical protein [Cryptosporangium phraense]|uniref:Uncharacterized protein n=1 Tax=Cryptosporangium phraense TaxID=2593070 RepID=A0A545AWI1_9ACTN|nr:hypothetical protein [Cryptosporangium phraense]TQS44965.1 hypothetical protein FL583_10680 [Cryptosporangium phraense]